MPLPQQQPEPWRAATRAAEEPCLAGLARAGLQGERGLRALAMGASLLRPTAEERTRALALVRDGLGQDDEARWDAAHAAAEWALAEVASELEACLRSPASWVRARAAEALGQLAPARAKSVLQPLTTADPDWTVRRLCADALRLAGRPAQEPDDPFSRYRALVRTGRVRQEAAAARPDLRALLRLGLRLPPTLRGFLLEVCPGGKVQVEGHLLALATPLEMAGKVRQAAGSAESLTSLNDYVWQRYVEGSGKAPKLDEDQALRRYGARYDGGLVDDEAWSYGLLLFESAFRDEARRGDLLVLAKDVLAAYRGLVDEAWDVVDDRLAEAEELVAKERLASAPERRQPLLFAQVDGVVELTLDLLHPGVWAKDGEGRTWQVAPSLGAFLADPTIARPAPAAAAPAPAATGAAGAGAVPSELAPVEEHLAAGRLKQAGRALGDALEADRSDAVLERAAELLQRPTLTPLQAAQVLAVIPLAGDKPTAEVVRTVLSALPAERALAMIEAVASRDDDSQVALFIDAASGLRKKSHAAVSDAARRLKKDRGQAHLRTTKNPFYKT